MKVNYNKCDICGCKCEENKYIFPLEIEKDIRGGSKNAKLFTFNKIEKCKIDLCPSCEETLSLLFTKIKLINTLKYNKEEYENKG